jgi:hypothetical protein
MHRYPQRDGPLLPRIGQLAVFTSGAGEEFTSGAGEDAVCQTSVLPSLIVRWAHDQATAACCSALRHRSSGLGMHRGMIKRSEPI